jgi:hypothetical protein
MQLESESQALYKKADKYESNARKGIYTKAEYERRVKAGKLPPVEADLEDNGPPTEADFWRYGR